MVFPLDLNKSMEKKYPGIFDELKDITGTDFQVYHMFKRSIPQDDIATILALAAWRKNKVIFHFDTDAAMTITTMTTPPEKSMPTSELRHLPYSSFALKTVGINVLDSKTDTAKDYFTGNAFVWIDGDTLNTAWEKGDGKFESAYIELEKSHTINDTFDDSVVLLLSDAGYSSEDIVLLKRLLDVSHFHELTEITQRHYTRMRARLGEDTPVLFNKIIHVANLQDILLSRLINIILYLGCDNADIENAAEKLKAGAMAGMLKDKDVQKSSVKGDAADDEDDRHVSKTEAKAAIREIGNSTVFDVGYRIAAKWRRQARSKSSDSSTGKGTSGKRGYGTRRAHWHHFWIGPRKGEIADDIMNPLPGERGLRRNWVDDTEIHPELKDDTATVIPVD